MPEEAAEFRQNKNRNQRARAPNAPPIISSWKNTFRCTPEVKHWLLKEGADPKYGTRHLKHVIERNIVYGLANLVATGQTKGGECITVDRKPDGSLGFSRAATAASTASAAD